MAKAVWTGPSASVSSTCPVGLYSRPRTQSIHFNQFRAGTSERIRKKRVGEQTGDEGRVRRHRQGTTSGGGEYVDPC